MPASCPSCGIAIPDRLACPGCALTCQLDSATTALTLVTAESADSKRRVAQLDLSPEFRARYALQACIGAGAMGVVYAATQVDTGREVAVKFLILQDEPTSRERFLLEAKLLARITHPNVLRVFDAGLEGEHPYLVTERLAGPTLHQRMMAGRMAGAEVVEVGLELLAGLAACHAASVVHRDIKPANVMYGAEGRARIVDLGIARTADGGAKLTRAGALVGTPRYMSPEQIRGEVAGPPSDLYSIACVLFEVCAGRPPFIADTIAKSFECVLHDRPPRLDSLVPDAPRGLVDALDKALEKRPEDRPASAAAMADILAGARLSRRQAQPTGPPTREIPPPAARGRDPRFVACVLAVAVGLAILGLRGTPGSVAAPSSAASPAPAEAVSAEPALPSTWTANRGGPLPAQARALASCPPVHAVALAPSGNLAIVSFDKQLREPLFGVNLIDGSQHVMPRGLQRQAIARDGRTALSFSRNTQDKGVLRLVSLPAGRAITEWVAAEGNQPPLRCFIADGAGEALEVTDLGRLFRCRRGGLRSELDLTRWGLDYLQYSASALDQDGTRLLMYEVETQATFVLGLDSGRRVDLKIPKPSAETIADTIVWHGGLFLRGGLHVLVIRGRAIYLMDTERGTIRSEYRLGAKARAVMALSSDEELLAAPDGAGVIHLWQVHTGRLMGAIPTGDKSLRSLAVDVRTRTVQSVGLNGQLAIWSFPAPR